METGGVAQPGQADAIAGNAIQEADEYIKALKKDSKAKAKEALSYQTESFESKASEYQEEARDICQREVAHVEQTLEADAWSAIDAKNADITSLRSRLIAAQETAKTESAQKADLLAQANALLDQQRATSMQNEAASGESFRKPRMPMRPVSKHRSFLSRLKPRQNSTVRRQPLLG